MSCPFVGGCGPTRKPAAKKPTAKKPAAKKPAAKKTTTNNNKKKPVARVIYFCSKDLFFLPRVCNILR